MRKFIAAPTVALALVSAAPAGATTAPDPFEVEKAKVVAEGQPLEVTLKMRKPGDGENFTGTYRLVVRDGAHDVVWDRTKPQNAHRAAIFSRALQAGTYTVAVQYLPAPEATEAKKKRIFWIRVK